MRPFSFSVTLAKVSDGEGGRACQYRLHGTWSPLGVLRCLDLTAALEKGHFIPQRMQKLLKKGLSTGALHRSAFF